MWRRAVAQAIEAGAGEDPVCVHCAQPVPPRDEHGNPTRWHEAHVVAKAFGGSNAYSNTGVAHDDCNLRDGARVVGELAKRRRMGKRKPARHPLPGGVLSHFKRTLKGRVVLRVGEHGDAGERHAATMSKRYAASALPLAGVCAIPTIFE